MIEPIRFSIVTVAYNEEDTIESTLRSIVDQDWPHLEIIFIDGASKDRTVERARNFQDRIRHFVSEPDRGIYDAMNKGLSLATGHFVCFMNGGDVFSSPHVLGQVAREVHSRETCHLTRARVEGRHSLFYNPPLGEKPERWIGRGNPCHQATFYPRKFAAVERYDLDLGSVADSDYTFRCLTRCGWEFHEVTTAHFRLGGTSNQFDQWRNAWLTSRARLQVLRRHRRWFAPTFAVIYTAGPIIGYILGKLVGERGLGKLRSFKGRGKHYG